jgi:copper chaperone CopZ
VNALRRRLVSGLAAVLLLAGLPAAAAESKATTTLAIQGMTCGGCVAAVRLQLKRTDGVTSYEVSLEKAEALVTYDPGHTDAKAIADSVSKTGFRATLKNEPKHE